MAIFRADEIEQVIAQPTDDSPHQRVTADAAQVIGRDIRKQAPAVIANLCWQAEGQGTNNAAAHAETVQGAEQPDDKGADKRDIQPDIL